MKKRELSAEVKERMTEKLKQLVSYSPEQLGEVLYNKLKDDHNYAEMCMFCKNSALLLAAKMDFEVPEQGNFERSVLSFDNAMWNWDYIDVIALIVEQGPKSDTHRVLSICIPFGGGMRRVMYKGLFSGTKAEIQEFLRSPAFGPRFVTELDQLNTALSRHN